MTHPLVLLLALSLAVSAAAAPRRRPDPCPAGRFLVQGAPLLAGAATTTDAIEAGSTRIAIGTACAPVAPKQFKRTARGTRVKAKWPSCTGFTGKVTLTGTIVDGCATLRGTVKAKRFKGKVEGRLSSCGDGVVDAGGGEQCEPPAGPDCDDQCRRPSSFVFATIGPQGGRITSSDGRLTLDIPPGALAADTVISIRPAVAGELPASLTDPDGAYDLGPDGLQFQVPVTVTYQLDSSLGPNGELTVTLVSLALSSDGSEPEPLADQRIVVDAANQAALTGTLTHFTVIHSDNAGIKANVDVRPVPGAVIPVNQPFTIQVSARILGSGGGSVQNPALNIVHTNLTQPGIIRYTGGSDDVTIGALERTGVQVSGPVPYECGPIPGTQAYLRRVKIDKFPALEVPPIEIQCVASTTTTTTTRPTTTSTSTTRSTTTTTSTTTTSTSSTATTTTTTSTLGSTTTVTTTSTTTTTTLPRIHCCDCPLPQGCASGPDVQPDDCVANPGCVFVADAVCTDTGDCIGITTTTSSTTTTSTSSTTTSTASTTTTVSTSSSTSTTRAPQMIRGPEGIRRIDDELFDDDEDDDGARLREGTLVSVATARGWAIVDYVTGEVVVDDYLSPFPSQLFEAIPLGGSSAPGAGLDVQAIVQVGLSNTPAITGYDLATGEFGFTQITVLGPTCNDAVAYGGDALSGGAVVACGRRVSTREAEALGTFNGGTAYSQFPQPAGTTTTVMSGFRRQQGGPIVAVTDGTPGKIWKHPATGASNEVPQELGASQNSPRRVRCTPTSVCAVSNFGSDSLTILTWDAQDNIAIVGTVSVGDGPVGIDIRARKDGNVEVVSTGFNDDSYSITVLNQNGGTVSNQEKPAPASCDAPGHAIWGPGDEIILSCNGSDNIVLVPNP